MPKIIGIDPGEQGAVAILEDGHIKICELPFKNKIPIFKELDEILNIDADLIVLEEPFIRNGNKNGGVGNQFISFGVLLDCAMRACDNVVRVSARSWKAKLKVTSDKQTCIRKSKELFPDINLLRTPRCTTAHDGFAEAALLAYWGREFGI